METTTIKVMSRKAETPLEKRIEEEYQNYLQEQEEDELARMDRDMEEAGSAFRRWFGDFPYHFEQAELVQGAGSKAPIKILLIRTGEISLNYHTMGSDQRFKLVRVCNSCGMTFLDHESRINNLRTLALEVKKEGSWYCARCDYG